MKAPPVPHGLRGWDARLNQILARPFPPADEPQRKETPQWDKLSSWSLVCEEVLDTEPSAGILTQYYHELLRRGFTAPEIQEMRHFAWLTAGWLNFEKMLWDWCHLDEKDILMAIDWQAKDGLITEDVAATMRRYVQSKEKKCEQEVQADAKTHRLT